MSVESRRAQRRGETVERTETQKMLDAEKTKQRLGQAADVVTDFIPGVSETKDIISLGQNIGKGQYLAAGADAVALGLGAVPVAGDMARRAFKTLANKFIKTKKVDSTVSSQDALKLSESDIDNWKVKNQTSSEFQKKLKGRSDTLQGMAQGLKDKVITKKEYREAADAIRPIKTVKDVPKPASFKDTLSALDSRQRKNPIVGVNYNIPEGDKISARLDITAYTQYDTWIPTLKHEGKTMYKPSVVLKDVTFIKPEASQVGKALNVATGKPKAPFAVMEGKYVDADNDSTFKYAKKIFKDKDVIQIGYDPTRRGFFYDRKTGNPVLEADEVVQVGHLVLAKKAKIGNPDDFFYSKGGDVMDKDIEMAVLPKARPEYLKRAYDIADTDAMGYNASLLELKTNPEKAIQNEKNMFYPPSRFEGDEEVLKLVDKIRGENISFSREDMEKNPKVGFNKGGIPQQMEMFQDGGLKDEGNTVDPVSGNEVPPGATQEEVRDDIPAQLSEGEFVFPADVVRYIGLEKLMMMRQEAKAGLARMEAMGQMGNADEATLPDDIPFTLDDLDTREETEDDVIKANIGTFVPPRFPTGQPYNPNVNPYQATGVVPTVYAPATGTGLLGASAQGAPETENRRYVNKTTGQVRMIPFVKATGQSLYPIPEGFVAEAETVKEEQPKQKTAKVQTAKVQDTSSGDDGDDEMSTLGGARMDVGGREFAVGYNFDGSITLTDPTTKESKTYNKDSQMAKDVKSVTVGQLVDLAKVTPAGLTTTVINRGLEKIGVTLPGNTKIDDIKKKQKEAKNRLDNTPSGVGVDPTTGMTLDDMRSIQAGLEGKGTLTSSLTDDDVTKATEAGQRALDTLPDRSDVVTASQTQQVDSGSDDPSGGFSDEGFSDSGYGASEGSFGGIGDFNQGGLAKKKKPKVKKMKRGGLASKK